MLFLALLLTLNSLHVLAQSNSSDDDSQDPLPTDNIERAYQCLEDELDERSSDELSLEEAIFSILATGSDSKLIDVIEDNARNDECWPESSCTVKDTSQVMLAYERINRNTEDIEDWLLEREEVASDLTWLLQIDISNHEESICTISYDGQDRQVTINEDMKLSGGAGSCLSLSSSGFWLRVNNECLDETFRVSCDQDFVTSMLYQRSGSSTIFVSPETNSAAALGTTEEEEVESKCITGNSNSCDYEGTLWASIALDKAGNDASKYLPYLLALAQDNERLFPSTFLHLLTNGDDQYSEIIQAQQQGQYWQAPNTKYNRFYDTSLAMLALQESPAAEVSNAQNYLLNIQTPEGCWNNNNIRDTAFVLYSTWSKSVPGSAGAGSPQSCSSAGHECVSSLFACADAGGTSLDFDCDLGICCSVNVDQLTCNQKNGIVCSASQTCSDTVVNSLDGSCCLGACLELPTSDQCELSGGGCHTECISGEEQTSDSCNDPGLVCCVVKSDSSSGSFPWFWVILLLVLIVLVVLAILYRKKLQLWVFKLRNRRKGKGRKGPSPKGPGKKPPFRPYGPGQMRRPLQRPPQLRGRQPVRPQPRSKSQTDKELEETLKKLKEMGK